MLLVSGGHLAIIRRVEALRRPHSRDPAATVRAPRRAQRKPRAPPTEPAPPGEVGWVEGDHGAADGARTSTPAGRNSEDRRDLRRVTVGEGIAARRRRWTYRFPSPNATRRSPTPRGETAAKCRIRRAGRRFREELHVPAPRVFKAEHCIRAGPGLTSEGSVHPGNRPPAARETGWTVHSPACPRPSLARPQLRPRTDP